MPSNTARIAKNTLMLYFRQILIMLVSLYTVRVVLNTLGAEDYGIYNVVGGVVVMFSFLNTAMTSATQRFLNFYMGQNDTEKVRDVFSISLIIHILIAIVLIILAETVGLWFFYNWLNIPLERMNAAFWVYQFSVLSTVIGILQVPYRATIISYEKMSFFAFLSIIEVLLKLLIVFMLSIIIYDKLFVYSFLTGIVGFVVFFIHKIYCNLFFKTARFRNCKDKKLFKQIAGFSGWGIFGQFVGLTSNHGVNILINIFHGVTVNAAIGIANQINSAVYLFTSNFQTAFRPQIIKSYSAKDYDYFMRLIFQTSKISYCLLLLFVLPLYLNADFVLFLWLKYVPEYTVEFMRMILLYSLVETLAGPLWMSIHATGNVKSYHVIASLFVFANLPLSFLALLRGLNPVYVIIIKVGINFILFIWRLFFIGKRINLSIKEYCCKVIIPIVIITICSTVITILSSIFFIDWQNIIITCIVSTVCIVNLVYFVGLTTQERYIIKNWLTINNK